MRPRVSTVPEKQVRRDAGARRAEIIGAARGLFLERSCSEIAMGDVAAAGSVSRALVYRYFPAGCSEVFVAVVEDLVGELHERLRPVAGAPFSEAKRMEHLLAALFTFFADNPDAYRLLFREAWASRDDDVVQAVAAARAPLVAVIAEIVGGRGGTAQDVLLISTGILGCALANIELALAGTVDTEAAWRVTYQLAVAQLT